MSYLRSQFGKVPTGYRILQQGELVPAEAYFLPMYRDYWQQFTNNISSSLKIGMPLGTGFVPFIVPDTPTTEIGNHIKLTFKEEN